MNKKIGHILLDYQLLARLQISLLFLLLSSFGVFGQGILKGVISGTDNDFPLMAATVVVKSSTIGVTTNFNGEYVLTLKAGTYTIKVSYIGYETKEESVTIENNQTTILNMNLGALSILEEEVVVTMQAKGQIAAVNQQIRSNQIINVVSAERIRELPDANVAQTISRLPGVTLDGSKVVIRGIESKMNKVLINGIEMPSTEANNRATDLEMISANMLSGIEVYKTLTPNMDADAIGGVVNLKLRSAPNGFHTSLTVQGGYNAQEALFGKKMLWSDISKRFLDNKLGVLLNMNVEAQVGGDDWISATYEAIGCHCIGSPIVNYILSGVNVYDQQKTTNSYGGSLVIDYKLPKGQLVYTGMLSHSAPEEILYRDEMLINFRYRYFHGSHNKSKSLLLNNTLRLEQQLGIVWLDVSFSNVSINRKDDFRYETIFMNGNTNSFVDSLLKFPRMLEMESWEIYDAVNSTAIDDFRLYDTKLIPNQYNESQRMTDLNLQTPLKISDNIDINLRFGGKYAKKDRKYNQDYLLYDRNNVNAVNEELAPWFALQGISYTFGESLYFADFQNHDYSVNKNFMNNSSYYKMDYVSDVNVLDKMWLNQVNIERATTNMMITSEDARDDYWGTENKIAAYAMAEINLGKKITIVPGVRYESVTSAYSAYNSLDTAEYFSIHKKLYEWEILDTLNNKETNIQLLPHLHARYHLNKWCDVRFSYNKSLSRPNYNYTTPMIYASVYANGEAGNPTIKPAVSSNLDASFTFFARKMGLITIEGYIKNIRDIFYMQATMIKNLPDTTISNQFPEKIQNNQIMFYMNSPYTAHVKGLELQWQSNFSWLPSPFNGLVLNTNYTHIWSETEYMQNRILFEYAYDENGVRSRAKLPVERDTSYTNRLINQCNDIANVSVGYDYKGFSARVSFRFQGNVISKIGSHIEGNEYTNDIYGYDFVVKQKIPNKFADFEVFFNAINFTNVPHDRYSIYPNKGETNTYSRYSGAQFQLGLRLRH